MTLWSRWLKRAALGLPAAVLVLILGAGYFFVRERVVDDRRVPFPSQTREPAEGFRASAVTFPIGRIRWTAAEGTVQATPVSTADMTRLRDAHPESNFQWNPAVPFAARATLSDPPGWTRLDSLAGPVGTLFEWRGVPPPGAWFQCRIGILTQGTDVRFSIDLEDAASGKIHRLCSAPVSVIHHTVSKKSRRIPSGWKTLVQDQEHRDEQWRPVRVDLSDWGGRAVRIRLNTAAVGPVGSEMSGLALWGTPEIRFPQPVPATARSRKGPQEIPILLTAFASAPDDLLTPPVAERSRLSDFLRESVSFPFFYTSDVRPQESMESLFLSTPTVGWPTHLARQGYHTRAVGAFSDDMMDLLDRAGFDEIHRLPHDGYDTIRSAARAVSWVRDDSLARDFVFLYFSDMPHGRLGPLRYGVRSMGSGWARWPRACETAYRDDYFGRVVDATDESGAWLTGVVSLRGTGRAPVPIVDLSGRRKTITVQEPGWAMRENEIRVPFGLRSVQRWAPGVCRSPGQTPDVGPTVLGALQIPFASGHGRVWVPEKAVASSDSSGVWAIRSAWAKAVVVDGQYKYIRHRSRPPVGDGRTWAGGSVRTDFPAEEVFDLWNDPGERNNLARERRNLLARLREALDDVDPDPVEVRLSFLNPSGERVDAMVNCVQGQLGDVFSSVGGRRMGPYEFVFSTNAASGDLRFRTWPPLVPFRLRLLVNGKSLDPARIQVGRWGIPLFEIKGDEWFDKTKFGWMDGWTPPRPSTFTAVSLGRVILADDGGETP